MNLSLTNKASFFILFFITILLAPLTAFSATEETTDWLNESINLSFQNEPLSNVLKQISQQTGISIAYDQQLANEKISGNYQNIKTADAITRLFRSKNKTIQVNKENRTIIVKTFGAKSFVWTGTNQKQSNSSQMTLAELEKMHSRQSQEYKDYITKDNEIVEGGVTRGAIRAMHKNQYETYQATKNNNDEIIEEGKTRREVNALHKKQLEISQVSLNNDNEILEEGLTRAEVGDLHKRQYLENNPNKSSEVLTNGITRAQIDILHKKQLEEFL